MLPSLQLLARIAPTVLGRVADFVVPGSGQVVQQFAEKGQKWYADKKTAAEREEILRALQIAEEKLNAFNRMFIILGKECGDLLDRVAELELRGEDPADLLAREVIARPELQRQFDGVAVELARLDGRVSGLEADVRRLDEGYASLGAFAAEMKMLKESNADLKQQVADLRNFQEAKQLQHAGRFAESEPILLELAKSQQQSVAVAVAQAVAKHDDPPAFDSQVKRAVRLNPGDANLRALASAATVAVTGRKTPSAMPTPSVRRVPQVGDTLDGWLLEFRLGGGGWGIVFRASKRGQTRAIKVMRPDLATEADFVEAFREEVNKLKRLRHHNCITVEENWFCTAFQCHYFVMPLLDGLNLEQHLDQFGKPTDTVAMGWLTGLLDGLEHAHTSGLIHRDIKPQNVMILRDNSPVLIDFGIAGLDGVPGYTQALGVSRLFAPPEQQSLGQADTRADLFSLAATIFYALRYDHPAERLAHDYEPELVPDGFRKAFDAALATK